MDAKTQAAFERAIAAIKANPLWPMVPKGAEAELRAAIADGIDRREATKIVRALDTAAERDTVRRLIQQAGVAKADVDTLMAWLLTAVKAALAELPPVVTPPAVTGRWKATEIHSLSKVYKFKTVVAVEGTKDVLFTSYNRETRVYSAIDRIRDGKKEAIWIANEAKGQKAETIGGGDRLGNTIYFVPEQSKHILKYDVPSGKVSKGSVIPHPYAVECCAWGDRVVYGASNEGGSVTAVYDAETGKKIMDSPIKGLISALASDGADLWWVVAGKGVCNSKGEQWKLSAASIAVWSGVPYVGAQDNGNLYYLNGGSWRVKQTFAVSKINRLVVDTRDNCLLMAAANPDTFLRMLPSGVIETLGRWTDQGVSVSGEQFDTYINEGHGTSILGSRALAAGCKGYRFDREGTVEPPAPTPVEPPTEPPATPPTSMPSDLQGVGQSGFLWKPNAAGGGGGLVVLFNGKLIPFVKSATINGKDSRQQVPPYGDGRGAIRWSGKTFPGAVTLTFNLSDGRKLNYAIPNGLARTEKVKPAVSQ